jgi:hypothetical protein
LLVFLTWAAAAYAAVGADSSEVLTTGSATTELRADIGSAARLAALLVVGFLPAVFLIARAGRSRPTSADLADD